MRWATRLPLVLLAIIFLIEAWLWRHLQPVVEWVVARIPLRELKARLGAWIETIPPPAALVVLAVPGVLLFPLKIVALWLIAYKHFLSAALLFVFAKLTGLGFTAFVFEATRPKLLQMAWFRWLYQHIITWLAYAHALVDPIKLRIRRLMHLVRPQRASRAMRLFWRIRHRMRAGAGSPA
jgi:hypothetical protein